MFTSILLGLKGGGTIAWSISAVDATSCIISGTVLNELATPSSVQGSGTTLKNELFDFLEFSPLPINVVTETGVILWANSAALSLAEFAEAEYVGHSIMEVFYLFCSMFGCDFFCVLVL